MLKILLYHVFYIIYLVEWIYSKNIPFNEIKGPSTYKGKVFSLTGLKSYDEIPVDFVKHLLSVFCAYEHESSFLDI